MGTKKVLKVNCVGDGGDIYEMTIAPDVIKGVIDASSGVGSDIVTIAFETSAGKELVKTILIDKYCRQGDDTQFLYITNDYNEFVEAWDASLLM